MILKDKLIIIFAGITMTLCVLFGVTWVTNGMGMTHFDLPILIQGIETIKSILMFFGGMQ